MKIRIEADWDDEAKVWVASSSGDIGLVTEAATLEELRTKLEVMVPDLLGESDPSPWEIELVARSSFTIAAE